MFKNSLNKLIQKKNSLLCVGLDVDIERIPRLLWSEEDPLLTFSREIIRATGQLAVAFKLNMAFYESQGFSGYYLLEKTLDMIPSDALVIADAKRADIGNSSQKYAETFFQNFSFDAITVSPYMGKDSIIPFLQFKDRGVFVLCLTSNPGSGDFQYLTIDSEPLYLHVARQVVDWNLEYGNCGLVVGATHPEDLGSIREVAPNLPFLIPGIGAQGGNLFMAIRYGTDRRGDQALISASRSILYSSSDDDFAEAAGRAATELRDQMNQMRQFKKVG